MRYRQKPYTTGAEIAQMLEELVHRVRGDELTLILNGDIFDFDAPRVSEGRSVPHDLPRTAENAVPAIEKHSSGEDGKRMGCWVSPWELK